MGKCKYLAVHLEDFLAEEPRKPELDKKDDTDLPRFVKEVPVSSSAEENNGYTSVSYEWPIIPETDDIKITKFVFESSESRLKDVYKIRASDGINAFSMCLDGTVYILRQTADDIAQSLLIASKHIRAAIEKVVGYLKTLSGNVYVISRIEQGSWIMDRSLLTGGCNHLRYTSECDLSQHEKSRLTQLIYNSVKSLHTKRLILGSFSLSNVLLSTKNLVLTDLRGMRLSRDSSALVNELKSILRYLHSMGLAAKADVYHMVADYSFELESECSDWYKEKTGRVPKDQYEIVSALENEVYV